MRPFNPSHLNQQRRIRTSESAPLRLFYIYYGLPEFGVVLSTLAAVVVDLSANPGGLPGRSAPGALQAIDTGQRQAALALG